MKLCMPSMTAHEYLESRGWVFDGFGLWLKDGTVRTTADALWIEWQDLAQCFAECVVAFRVNLAFALGRGSNVNALMQAALNKHKIEPRIK